MTGHLGFHLGRRQLGGMSQLAQNLRVANILAHDKIGDEKLVHQGVGYGGLFRQHHQPVGEIGVGSGFDAVQVDMDAVRSHGGFNGVQHFAHPLGIAEFAQQILAAVDTVNRQVGVELVGAPAHFDGRCATLPLHKSRLQAPPAKVAPRTDQVAVKINPHLPDFGIECEYHQVWRRGSAMSERVNKAISAALQAAKSNPTLAQKALITAALEDDQLLRELVAPYLKPIVAQAIERATRAPRPAAAAPASKTLSTTAKAILADLRAGYNPMKAAVSASEALPQRPSASGRHVSTLKLIAAAYQVKRGERA